MSEINAGVYETKSAWKFEYASKNSFCASVGPKTIGGS